MKHTKYIRLTLISLTIGLTACADIDQEARLAPADYLDAGTTAIGLATNFEETNPIISPCGLAAPVCALALKYGVKSVAIRAGGSPKDVNRTVETLSMLAGCMNLITFSGASIAPAAFVGIGCAVYFNKQSKMNAAIVNKNNPTEHSNLKNMPKHRVHKDVYFSISLLVETSPNPSGGISKG